MTRWLDDAKSSERPSVSQYYGHNIAWFRHTCTEEGVGTIPPDPTPAGTHNLEGRSGEFCTRRNLPTFADRDHACALVKELASTLTTELRCRTETARPRWGQVKRF
jgi:hypothetical protein